MPFSDLGQHASGLYGSGSKWFNMNALVTEVFESYRYWGYFPFSSPKQFFPDLMSVNWHTDAPGSREREREMPPIWMIFRDFSDWGSHIGPFTDC